MFLALLLARLWIAWRNWQKGRAPRTGGHLTASFARLMIGCMWYQDSLWKLPLPVSSGFEGWTKALGGNAGDGLVARFYRKVA